MENKKKIMESILIFLLLIFGCSNGFDAGEIFTPEYGHPQNWINPASIGESDYHASAAFRNDGGIHSVVNTCQECHGEDLDGGIAIISCHACHNGLDTGKNHPEGWMLPDAYLHFHGYYGKNYTVSCSVCHGETLSGQSALSCFTCHDYENSWNTFGDTATSFIGVASKGPIYGGLITCFELTDNFSQRIGNPLAFTITERPDGSYYADIGQYKGPVLLELNHGEYEDEATGLCIDNTYKLRAVVSEAIGKRSVVITPLTEVAYRLAEDSMGGLMRSNIDQANSLVSAKLLGADIVTTVPVFDGNLDGYSQAQRDYGLALSVISQMQLSFGNSVEESMYLLFDDLAEDGELNQTIPMLLSSINDFLGNPENKTGITDLKDTNLDEVWTEGKGDTQSGEILFLNNCSACHSPTDFWEDLTVEDIIDIHPWIENKLTHEQIQTIIEYMKDQE